MKYLGIDYGSKRVGVAISDEDGSIAFPKVILKNDLSLLDNIFDICEKEKISAIVLGESHDLSGKPNKIMGSIEEFKQNLEGELDMPIYYEKEFMTSVFARGNEGKSINNSKKVKKDDKGKVDSSAAALILQRYLDKVNN
jgi:putative Holliday junction resolvase